MSIRREIKEGRQDQGTEERVVYTLTTTPWGSSPTTVVPKIYSYDGYSTYTDVTDTCMTGSATVSDDVITLPVVHSLTAGTTYRVEIKFTISANVFEAYAWIDAER